MATDSPPAPETIEQLQLALPVLRRYGRALLCSQSEGDGAAAAALERIVREPARLSGAETPKIALFKAFHDALGATPSSSPRSGDLSGLPRQALLLCGMEGFSTEEAGVILAKPATLVAELVDKARRDVQTTHPGSFFVIEDELIISLDLQTMLSSEGHTPVGSARTHREAVSGIAGTAPDVILADLQLADNSSGLEAVNEVLQSQSDIPIVFITAHPELLLTGKRPEPSFLIPKPYSRDEVVTTMGQALLFSRSRRG